MTDARIERGAKERHAHLKWSTPDQGCGSGVKRMVSAG
jgi:hypothetical protein